MSDSPVNLRSPLHEIHLRHGAKMIPFGGWEMPVQYTGIIEEHLAVRSALGVFDISHMGEIFVEGPEAAAWLNRMLTNNIDRVDMHGAQYTFLLNEKGGVIDDLIVYRIDDTRWLLVVNASRIAVDEAWLREHLAKGVTLENVSDLYAGLAIQGPRAPQLFDLFFGGVHSRPTRNEIKRIDCGYMEFFISSTGYTGEDGFEIFFPAEHVERVWHDLFEKGAAMGMKPCGLGARDTLRLEMCYPLNGSDLSSERTPLEAGLSIFVDLNKHEFIGREALLRQREEGVPTRLVPFKMVGKSPPPRPHYPIFKNGVQIGEIASGTLSPSLNEGIGMAYLPVELARIGEQIEIDIRGKKFIAVVERKPFLKK